MNSVQKQIGDVRDDATNSNNLGAVAQCLVAEQLRIGNLLKAAELGYRVERDVLNADLISSKQKIETLDRSKEASEDLGVAAQCHVAKQLRVANLLKASELGYEVESEELTTALGFDIPEYRPHL